MSAVHTGKVIPNIVLTHARTNRVWYILTTVVVAITVIGFAAYLVLAINWHNRPFFGAMLSHTLVVGAGRPTTGETWTGFEAGLLPGDQIVSIKVMGQDRQTLANLMLADSPTDYATARQNFATIMSSKVDEDTIMEVHFNRPLVGGVVPKSTVPNERVQCPTVENNLAQCWARFTTMRLPEGDFLAYFFIPFISGLVVLLTGLVILRLRYEQPVALLAVTICMALAIFMAGIFDVNTTYTVTPLWLASGALLGALLTLLGLIFPTTMPLANQRRWVRYVPFGVAAIFYGLILLAYNPPDPSGYPVASYSTAIVALLGMFMLFIALFYQRRRATSAIIRDQSNTVWIGIWLVMLPAAVWLISRVVQLVVSPQGFSPLSVESTMPFFITPAISIAYAVLQYRKFDTDKVISQGIVYGIMLVALIIGYFLLVLGATMFTQGAFSITDPLLIALTIFLISVLFLPMRTTLQHRIDQIYFRVRRNYQEKAEEFTQTLTNVTSYSQIIKEFNSLLNDSIAATNAFIFLLSRQTGDYAAYGDPQPETDVRFGSDSGVVTSLKQGKQSIYLEAGQPWPEELRVDRARLTILKTMFIAGLWSSETLTGFVLIGPPRSGTNRYNFEELRFLVNIISQLNVATERAQVIDSLQRRVRELDVLSQVGQAVNFTIQFDDLLELISNQTGRLIDAPYFYIALQDPTVDQLYFAFFLENDDRVKENENQRWSIGRDLFSEVVRTSQPLRVADYGHALTERNVKFMTENPNLKAWMGVPLVAGSRTLGVLAVGKTTANETFSDDQFKIFNDIGSLAASSIDKFRLFNETNMRARQLTVLNDISQQLVATESDVEQLLSLITRSAVDILNAEAGSLLLTADDTTGDLEFKVVIGGSGEKLIGSRLAAGKGLVGEVAKNGKPVIANDAVHDKRHTSELDEGKFRASSIIAVPLVAKNRVIGVLEVINKKDGTIYVTEDVELLTTFAGQAAVAIENARLFEMTDLQLSKRVQELEAIERIDNELNRTLDLKKVAEITVRWAIANSGAKAGALGVVMGAPPHLEIVASYGYKPEDHPDGADGTQWPLDRGIVKRVMRTRQADLATDVKIDPDYVPSLSDGLSQITVPMLSGDEINAILLLETNREPRLTLADWGFAVRLAEHASIAIQNAQLVDALARANDAKSEFVSFAAHELKNPLSSVKGYADILRNEVAGPLSESQKNFLTIIRSNSDRMQNIITDLQDSAKLDANQLKMELSPIDLRNVVIETLRPFQQQLEDKHQEVINHVGEGLPLIMGDQNRLIQVLTNLVSNAYKYSPPESTITIDAKIDRRRAPKGHHTVPVLHITVADTGIGMSQEDVAKIFKQRYWRSDNPLAREQPGTGLVMMITQGIVLGHNGDIWVESELGKGTTFHITIPLAAETPQPQPPAETPQTEPASD